MAEAVWVSGSLAILGGMAWLVLALPPVTVLWVALATLSCGALLGLPFGLLYHLRLREELRRAGDLPRRWYVHPTQFHERLSDAALARVWPSFRLGALGFGLMMLGCALATLTLFTRFG